MVNEAKSYRIFLSIATVSLVILFSTFGFAADTETPVAANSDTGETYSDTSEVSTDPENDSESSDITPESETDQTKSDFKNSTSSELEEIKDKETTKSPMTTMGMASTGEDGEGAEVSPVYTPENSVFTGAAGYKIPIKVPPGRNGLTPDISLNYNSYFKNGWIGVGWTLDMGAIRRSTRYGVDYDADDYVYEQNGSTKDLVSKTDDWGADYYGAKIEGDFSKYYFNSTTGGWEVTTKDGTRYLYGSSDDSRQFDPDNNLRIFKWCLDSVEDTNGNYMTISYIKDQEQIYLNQVDYAGNGSLAPSNYVKFYIEDRDDNEVMHTSNFKVVTAKRLKTIEVQANGETVGVYALQYTQGTGTSRSLISSIQKYGSDATLDGEGSISGGSSLAPMNFQYQQTEDNFNRSLHSLELTFDGARVYAQGDYNGDGKSDFLLADSTEHGRIVNANTRTYTYLSNGDGSFDQIQYSLDIDFGGARVYAQGDYNGDGKSDFLLADSTIYGRILNANTRTYTYLSNGDGSFDQIQYSLDIDFGGARVYAQGDYNGDGKSDFLLADSGQDGRILNANTRTYTYLSNGDGSFDQNQYSLELNFGGSRIYAQGDYNGDGKSDFLLADSYTDGRMQYANTRTYTYISRGDGSFDQIPCSLDLEYVHGSRVYAQGDFNGDGKTDFLLADSLEDGRITNANTRTYTYLSKGDGIFEKIPYSLELDWEEGARIYAQGDFNGDGKTDFLLAESLEDGRITNANTHTYNYLSKGDGTFEKIAYPLDLNWEEGACVYAQGDFDGDGKSDFLLAESLEDGRITNANTRTNIYLSKPVFPDLLDKFQNNHTGGTITIEYADSSQYENTLLPFIVHPVSSITIDDGLGNQSTTTYDEYFGGLYDCPTREFRGFEYVKQTNPDDTTYETWFHQDEFRKGREYKTQFKESVAAGSDLRYEETLTWNQVYLDDPDNTTAFVKLSQKRTDYYDSATVFAQEDYTYDDANGNLLSVVASGTDGENVTTAFDYANKGNWLWCTTEETVQGSSSGLVRKTNFEYESNTGNLLSKESWLASGPPYPREVMTYDNYGNRISLTDARGNTTAIDYDASTRTYPTVITSPATGGVAHIEHYQYDHKYGRVSAKEDENGNWTYYDFDPFGRLKQVDYPDGGQKLYEYYV